MALAVTCASGYAFYHHRKEQNTQKLLREAQQAASVADWAEAVASYHHYLRRNPSDTESLAGYADALFERLKEAPEVLGETLRVLRRHVRAHPEDTKSLGRLVELSLAIGDFSQADELSRQWQNSAPESADAVLARARALVGLHKEADAVDVLSAALGRRPAETRLYPMLIELLDQGLGRREAALATLSEALNVGATVWEVHMAAFALHHRGGDWGQARTHLQRALELAPREPQVLTAAAIFHLSHDELDEADQLLRQAEKAGNPSRALWAARTAWALKRNTPDDLTSTADGLAGGAGKDEPELLARAAELYLRAGRLQQADGCIDRLAASTRGKETVEVWLDTLRGARLLLDGRPYPAIPYLDKALRRDPAGLWAAELLALAYIRTGVPDEAAEMYRRILQAAPNTHAAHLALARIELRQGRTENARREVDVLSAPTADETRQATLIRHVCELQQANEEKRPPRDLQQTVRTLEEMAAKSPADGATVELLMQGFILAGRADAAVELFRNEATEPTAARWMGPELGMRLLAANEFDAGSKLADELAQRFPADVAGHALRVRVLAARKELDLAKTYVESSTLSGAALGRLWEVLGEECAAAGDNEAARAAWSRAIELLPSDIAVRHKLIRRSDSKEEALALVGQIRELEGGEGVQWRFERAWVLLRHARATSASEAVDVLKQCLSVRPGWVPARVLLGSAHEALGAWAEAADAYRTAIAQNDELSTDTVAIRLVEVLKRLGRFEEADAALSPLLAALPESPEVLRLQIDRHLRRRDPASAASTAQRMLDLSGDDPSWAAVTADLQLRAGNPAEGESIARAALERHPDAPSLAASLARTLVAQNRAAEAETLVREFAQRRNDGGAYTWLAQILVYMNRPAEAESAIATALEKSPQDAAVAAAAADFFGSRGDRTRQLTHARAAVALRGEKAEASLALATLLATGGTQTERDEAASIVRRRLETDPKNLKSLLLQAQLAGTASPPDYGAAQGFAQKALTVDPKSVEAHKTLAVIQRRRGDISAAAETVATALSSAPDDAELLLASAQLRCHRGEYEQALSALRRFLKSQPRMPDALRLLVTASHFAGKTDEAIAYLEQNCPADRRTVTETVLLAKLFHAQGQLAKAEEHFQKALELDRRSAEAFQEYLHFHARRGAFDQVYALASQRRTEFPQDIDSLVAAAEILGTRSPDAAMREQAMEWLASIADSVPERAADAVYRAGLCYYQRGDIARAEKEFQRAAELEPASPKPLNALAWLHCENLRQPEKALALLERFLSSGGVADAEMLDTHATVLLRLKRLDAAKQSLLRCLDLAGQTPTFTAANYHLGLVLVESKSPEEGLSFIRRALQLNDRVGGLNDNDKEEAQRLVSSAATHGAGQP